MSLSNFLKQQIILRLPLFLGIIVLFCAPKPILSQPKIDSLFIELEDNYSSNVLYDIAYYYFPDSLEISEKYSVKALEEARINNNIDMEIRALLLQGHIAYFRNESGDALKIYLKAKEISKKTKNYGVLSSVNYSIGRIYAEWSKYNVALDFLKESLEYAQEGKKKNNEAIVYNQLAECLLYLNKLDSAQLCLNNSYKYFIESGDTIKAIGILVNYSTVLHELEDYHKALQYELKALDLLNIITPASSEYYVSSKVSLLVNIGDTYLKLGNYSEALEFSIHGLQYAQKYNMLQWQMLSCQTISLTYSKLGQFENAFKFHQKYSLAKDSVFTKEKYRQVSEIETKYKTNQIKNKVLLLEKESHLQRILKISGFISAFLILVILILLRVRYRLKVKVHQKEKNELDIRINQKSRELISTLLLLSEKIRILNSIKGLLNKINLPENDHQKKYLHEANSFILQSIRTSDNWESIKKHFDEVHPSFIDTMLNKYPLLSQSELKHCTYIKMNLSTTEIAQLLNVSKRAIQTARYRLKQKMDLGKNEDLLTVIINS